MGGGSSQVNFSTPSGTNEFHGNLYIHNRNSKFSANQWFSNRTGLPKPFLNLNQFGASLAGPIVKNKLMFYTNYEGYRQRSQQLANAVILTPDARRGNLYLPGQRQPRAEDQCLARRGESTATPRPTGYSPRSPARSKSTTSTWATATVTYFATQRAIGFWPVETGTVMPPPAGWTTFSPTII